MKAYINEIEVTLAEPERETLKRAADTLDEEISVESGHIQPREIRNWLNTINRALAEYEKGNWEYTEGDRLEMLRIRQDLKEIVKGISKADEHFEEAY